MNDKDKILQNLIRMGDLDNAFTGFYHTFYVKKEEDNYKHVFSKSESDYTFTGEWCFNQNVNKIKEHMGEIEGRSVLDAGCCDGYFGFLFKDMGAKVTSLDITDRKPREGMSNLLGCDDDFIHQNIYQCDKLGKKYDYVWCQDVLCHMMHPMLAIMNFRKICKKKLFIGIDRFRSQTPEIETLYQLDQNLWSKRHLELMNKSVEIYGDQTYPYIASPPAFKRKLADLGFKSTVDIKFSYEPQGRNRMGSCKKRIVDVYEAEVDPEYHFDWKWNMHTTEYLHYERGHINKPEG